MFPTSRTRRAPLILSTCALAVLAACDDPLDFDLRGLGGGFTTSQAAQTATEARPRPAQRGHRHDQERDMPWPEEARDLLNASVEPLLKPPCHTAHNRQVNQRNQERGRQHKDQRKRQHFHELPWHARPKEQRQKGAKRRGW